MIHLAQTTGPNTARLFERIMADKRTSRTRRWAIAAARASFGWREKYSAQRMEAAAERALLTGACHYKSIESMLKNSLDHSESLSTFSPTFGQSKYSHIIATS